MLSLTGPASVADYQAALRSVAYLNTSDDPSGLTRTVSFSVHDGALGSQVATAAVSVTPVNDAPVATAGGGSLTYTENQAASVVDPALTLGDARRHDAGLGHASRSPATTLAARTAWSSPTRTASAASFDAATGVLSLSGVASIADYQAALRSVVYLNTSDDPSGLTRTVSFSVNDGALTSNVAITAVSVVPVNDAPVVVGGGGMLAHVENQAATAIDPALTLADIDDTTPGFGSCRDHRQPRCRRRPPGLQRPERHRRPLRRRDRGAQADRLRLGCRLPGRAALGGLPQHERRPECAHPHRVVLGQRRSHSTATSQPRPSRSHRSTMRRLQRLAAASLAYVENQTATAIDPALTLSDLDDSTLASATGRDHRQLTPAAKTGSSSATRTASAAASMPPPACSA